MCYAVVTFHTTHAAFQAEKAIRAAGIEGKLIPPPRDITADCTIALRVPATAFEEAKRTLEDSQISYDRFTRIPERQ